MRKLNNEGHELAIDALEIVSGGGTVDNIVKVAATLIKDVSKMADVAARISATGHPFPR
jgi:hypothetical protein